jgi:nucleotidyltransferase AbiEii toxin of type IV toxin-antitoxin system
MNPNHDKPQHVESRRLFFDKLQKKIQIPGITAVERDTEYDDSRLRNAGMRLHYKSHFDAVPGLKDGILLEVGFDQTQPNQAVTISSWVAKFAAERKLEFTDNRAAEVLCYNPEYTLVEKLQTVVKKFGQYRETGKLSSNFMRHYYDIHQLLDVSRVQQFIGTIAYLEHKQRRFRSLDPDIRQSGAFTMDTDVRNQFEVEYKNTAPLYYRGQIPLQDILARIQKDLDRL